MFFMPTQILGGLLRGLFTLALIGVGAYFLIYWYNHREVVVVAPPVVVNPDRPGEEPREEPRSHVVTWEFGWNRETYFLLGGIALLTWALGGGWLVPRVLPRPKADDPETPRDGAVQRIRRDDGTELHVEFYGPAAGPTIVLTHGWGLDSDEWTYARKRLSARHRLIVWDLPGLGKSKGPDDKDWSLEKLARDLDAVVALAGAGPVVLLGHSIGGMIVLTYCRLFHASLAPRVRGVVIAHSTYTNPARTTSTPRLHTALQKPLLEPLCHLMIWLDPLVRLMTWLSYLNGSVHRSTDKSSFSGHESRGQLDFISRYMLVDSPAVLGRGMLGMFRYDATATLPTIPVPALIVAGDRDETCVPEASAFMSRTIPNATLVTLPDSRHCGLFEHHETFHAAVEAFVVRCEG
jgi:pimeloyl-ACP methyl ester carboxylesterase